MYKDVKNGGFMIKLIATDMDGTLLDEDKNIPQGFFEMLNKLKEKGVAFVVASGRSYVTLYENFKPHSDSLDFICDNGAFVVINGGITNLDIIKPGKSTRNNKFVRWNGKHKTVALRRKRYLSFKFG